MSILEVSDSDFSFEVLESESPVLVDFWAEWCQPCKMLAPTFIELAAEFEGKVKFVKMNVDNQETPVNYNVRGIPALYLFIGGELKSQTHGALSKDDLRSFVNDALDSDA